MPEREELQIIHDPSNDKGVYKLNFWACQLKGLDVCEIGGKIPCTDLYIGKEVWVAWSDHQFIRFWIDGEGRGKSGQDLKDGEGLTATFDWCPIRRCYACTCLLDNKIVLKADFS